MLSLLFIVFAIWLLWRGADWVVESSAILAQRIGMSELVVGMTVVAVGTSAPELVVSLVAALDGHPDVSVANVVGSNICNTGMILGLCAALYCVPTSRASVLRDTPMLVVASCTLLVFLLDGTLGRVEGLVLLALLGGYLAYVLYDASAHAVVPDTPDDDGISSRRHAIQLAIGLGAVLAGARVLVDGATDVAEQAGLSDWVIGLTVVAGGTSLPELATALVAARRGREGLVIGNLVGSDIFNVLGVLGVAATVTSLQVTPSASQGLSIMVLVGCMLVLLMRSGWRLSRGEGLLLVGLALWRWSRDVVPDLW